MHWILIAALVSSAPQPTPAQPQAREIRVLAGEAAACVAKEVQTGSLIVTEGDCLAVKVFTRSPFTHVAAVVVRHGQPYVYDSANGVGVRCQTLANYLATQSPAEVHLFHPRVPLSQPRAERFEQHLDDQLGRPYAIKHHLTGNRADGLHCAEYVTDALMACNLLTANEPARVSPASLVEGILKTELYAKAVTLNLTPPLAAKPAEQGWCSAMWSGTKQCSRNCYLQLRGWFCCY